MTKWLDELPPRDDIERRGLMEWLIRSFQSLSLWSESTHARGYGGMGLSQPYDIVDFPLPVDPPEILDGNSYDTVLTPNPIGIAQDLAEGRLIPQQEGIWMITASVTAEITPNTANSANTIALGIWDETLNQIGDRPFYFTVPRYGESFTIGGSVPFRITSDIIGHKFGLAMWVLSPTPMITVERVIATDFHLTRLG